MSASPSPDTIEMVSALVAVFGMPTLGFIVWVVVHSLCAAFKASREIALKRDMVARGYSAQEIIDVVAGHEGAQAKSKSPLRDVPPAKPVRQPAYSP